MCKYLLCSDVLAIPDEAVTDLDSRASSAVVARIPALETFADPDFLWATTGVAVWSTIEQGLAITAGSLATLRPLLRLIFHKVGISTAGPTHGPSRGLPANGSGLMSPLGTKQRRGSQPAEEALSLSNFSKNRSMESSWARREKSEVNVLDKPLPPLGGKHILVTHEWECRSERKAPDNESQEELNRQQSTSEILDEENQSWERRKGTKSFIA